MDRRKIMYLMNYARAFYLTRLKGVLCADSQIAGIDPRAPCHIQPALIGLYAVSVDPSCQPNVYLTLSFHNFLMTLRSSVCGFSSSCSPVPLCPRGGRRILGS